MQRLRRANVETADEPGQEDFGWYFRFTVGGVAYLLVVGCRPDNGEGGEWIGEIERQVTIFGMILGRHRRGIRLQAAQVLHSVLIGSPEISDVRWHAAAAFRSGNEDAGALEPSAA